VTRVRNTSHANCEKKGASQKSIKSLKKRTPEEWKNKDLYARKGKGQREKTTKKKLRAKKVPVKKEGGEKSQNGGVVA